jgi:hypothetical protein
MSFIDKSYFIGDIYIPEDKYSTPIQTGIERYEPEILKSLLGYELYKLVIAESPTQDRIIKLINGDEFTVYDKTYEWIGLKNDKKISLIAYYVYYYLRRENITESTQFAEVQSMHENANPASPAMKIQLAWQNLKRYYGSANSTDNYESAYAYMKSREDDYPEWIFTELGSVNAFDL